MAGKNRPRAEVSLSMRARARPIAGASTRRPWRRDWRAFERWLMSDTVTDIAYWALDGDSLASRLGAGLDGLTSDKAAALLASVGPNSVEDAPRLTALRLLLRQFENPLVLILATAAVI